MIEIPADQDESDYLGRSGHKRGDCDKKDNNVRGDKQGAVERFSVVCTHCVRRNNHRVEARSKNGCWVKKCKNNRIYLEIDHSTKCLVTPAKYDEQNSGFGLVTASPTGRRRPQWQWQVPVRTRYGIFFYLHRLFRIDYILDHECNNELPTPKVIYSLRDRLHSCFNDIHHDSRRNDGHLMSQHIILFGSSVSVSTCF